MATVMEHSNIIVTITPKSSKSIGVDKKSDFWWNKLVVRQSINLSTRPIRVLARISKVAVQNNFVGVATYFCECGHMFLGMAAIFCC
jgi:hypothetical protein